jgi:hypothetical protein
VPLPYWDEWFSPGTLLLSYAKGTLSFSDFFYQHNESRKAFPYLLYITLAKIHGWDVRDGMVITLLEVAALCGLLLCLFLRTIGATAITALVIFAATTFLAFSPVQYENFLSGIQFETFFPGLAVVVAALVNLSRLRFGTKTIVNVIVALTATYTYANGMLLRVLGVPFPRAQESISKRALFKWYLLFALVGIGSVTIYFVNYKRPPSHPHFHFGVIETVHYIILWVGGYFQSARVSPFAVGSVVLLLWIAAVVNAFILVRRGAPWRHFYPWLLIGLYALTSSVITAMGRVGFGLEQALSSRYATFSLFIYLALVGTIFALYCYYKDNEIVRARRWTLVGAGVVIALALPAGLGVSAQVRT